MDWEKYSYLKLPVVMSYDDRYENLSWDELNELCLRDDPVAIYEKASRYRLGENIDKDINQAVKYYEHVLTFQKNTRAMYFLGCMLCEDLKSAECEKYFRLGSSLGDSDCSRGLGIIYRYGYCVEENSEQAIYYFKLSAEQGNPNSLVYAGEVCLDNEDYGRAFELFNAAFKSNDPVAAFYIGRMYYYGTGVEKNDDKAFSYLKIASDEDIKDANIILASMYGFGQGTAKDIKLAMKLLDNVNDDEVAYSYNIKGRIMISEGEIEEGRKWLQKAAEMGNENAQNLLDSSIGKSDEEMANEGSDPYAMIRYSSRLLRNDDGQKPDFHKALEIITRANQLYPDNQDVKIHYTIMLHMHGHIAYKVGAAKEAYDTLKQCFYEYSKLKNSNCNSELLNGMDVDLYMDYGEAAYLINDYSIAMNMFSLTDHDKYPYAVVLLALLHLDAGAGKYASELADEAEFMTRAISSEKWRKPFEKAMAYLMLSCIYSTGIPNYVKADVNYAYTCIKKCAEIDPELAEDELKKYSKGLFGKVTYRA